MSESPLETAGNRTPLWYVGAVLAWVWVAIPFVYGLIELVVKIPSLFG